MNTRFVFLVFSLALLLSCKSATEPGPVYDFQPMKVGSHWLYNGGGKNYTRTVVGDTTVNGKVYAVIVQDPPYKFTHRNLDSVWYYRKDGNTIYVLLSDSMNVLKECTYINPSSGASGSYYTLTFIGASERKVTRVSYSVTRLDFPDTVNGRAYPHVLKQRITSEVLTPGSISEVTQGDYYFADGVGLIDQIVSNGLTMELTDYEIK